MDFLMKTRFIELCRIVMKTRNDISYNNTINMSLSGDRCENTHIGMLDCCPMVPSSAHLLTCGKGSGTFDKGNVLDSLRARSIRLCAHLQNFHQLPIGPIFMI